MPLTVVRSQHLVVSVDSSVPVPGRLPFQAPCYRDGSGEGTAFKRASKTFRNGEYLLLLRGNIP